LIVDGDIQSNVILANVDICLGINRVTESRQLDNARELLCVILFVNMPRGPVEVRLVVLSFDFGVGSTLLGFQLSDFDEVINLRLNLVLLEDS
jgi:hypothetical protein